MLLGCWCSTEIWTDPKQLAKNGSDGNEKARLFASLNSQLAEKSFNTVSDPKISEHPMSMFHKDDDDDDRDFAEWIHWLQLFFFCSHAAGQEEGEGEGAGSQESSSRRHQPIGVSSQNSSLFTQRLAVSLPSFSSTRSPLWPPLTGFLCGRRWPGYAESGARWQQQPTAWKESHRPGRFLLLFFFLLLFLFDGRW